MNFNYRELLPEEMDGTSRVWIYQSSRLFTVPEVFQIEENLNEFVGSWNSHGSPVKGYGNLFFGQFIILMADETASGVSGCSTDSSVRLIKEMENIFNVQLFDRQLLAFFIKDKVQLLPPIGWNNLFQFYFRYNMHLSRVGIQPKIHFQEYVASAPLLSSFF